MRSSALLAVLALVSVSAARSETAAREKRKSKFQFTGVNESGAEFGNKNLPGQLGKDYTWPAKSAIDVGLYLQTAPGARLTTRP